MGEELKNLQKKHSLTLSDRKILVISGVTDVKNFDDSEILLETTLGIMSVEGENLHITKLSTDSGDVCVDGHIDAIIYERERKKSRLFGGK